MKKVIAVGGLGGSGTRVVAELFIKSGIYFGDWTRETNDNIAFSALFRGDLLKNEKQTRSIHKRAELFVKYMERDHFSLSEAISFIQFAKQTDFFNSANFNRKYIFGKVLTKAKERSVWGWKEPNTHLYLETFFAMLPGLKYIHVLRHGLDMAYSNNLAQVKHFGARYGITLTGEETAEEMAYKQLEYWIKSTSSFLNFSEKNRKNTYILNTADFCFQPYQSIKKLMSFCGLPIFDDQIRSLSALPKTPKSSGRYKEHDLGIFDQKQIDFVKQMGFEI